MVSIRAARLARHLAEWSVILGVMAVIATVLFSLLNALMMSEAGR